MTETKITFVKDNEIALEDAAKAAFIKAQSVYRADHDHFPLKNTWETTPERIREGWRSIAYVALEAAEMPPLGTQPEPRLPRLMTETKHTPTPWQAEPLVCKGAWIKGSDGNWAALSCGEDDVNGAANAALIVEAVNSYAELSRLRNSHTALVAALTNARSMLTAFGGDPRRVIAEHGSAAGDAMQAALLDQIDAALSAEGEKDAPKDECHLTLGEQDTFSQALRDSGTVRQTIPIAPKDDGWIEWKGGEEPPVDYETKVDVRFRNGHESLGGNGWYWGEKRPGEEDSEIVAYRRAR